ncbi:unnamed protein product [Hydatigera taeniaeformis]|uniref:Uncharacterized protein n=1 Tax=Hydatigena taeniaeformis TaxID=6205 RepID=A0A0R3WXB2_HYDTA|nr:unnamed protein product [Hydatigera taeniaeformis]
MANGGVASVGGSLSVEHKDKVEPHADIILHPFVVNDSVILLQPV